MIEELSLVKKINLDEIIRICDETPYKFIENSGYQHFKICNLFKFFEDNDLINYQFIRKKLKNKLKIPLYIIVGISNNSFANNLKILNNNIDKIEEKYSEVFLFLYDEVNLKRLEKKYLQEFSENKEFTIYDDEKLKEFAIKDKFKKKIAEHLKIIIDYLNNFLNYNSIPNRIMRNYINNEHFDLIGVSVSGGIAVFLSQLSFESSKLNNLILMAPGIFEGFKGISIDQKIILGWCIQDSKKVPYKTEGKKLIKELLKFKEKILILTDLGRTEPNDDITHRLQDGIFDYLSI
jgi:hypothetical protein